MKFLRLLCQEKEALKRIEYKNTDLVIMDISLKGEIRWYQRRESHRRSI